MREFNVLLKEIAHLPDPDVKIKPYPNGAVVTFKNGRRQMLVVERQGDRYLMTSVVLGKTRVDNIGRAILLPRIWLRNRHTDCVAFMLDKRGRLVGRITQIAETLDPSELAFYIKSLARECDQFEYVLIGQDVQ